MSNDPLVKVNSIGPAPERRCLSCGRRDAKERLMRFVRCERGETTLVVWDRHQQSPGRGGYVHPNLQCWARMSEPKRWRYGFRVTVESAEVQSVLVEVRNELVAATSSEEKNGGIARKFRPASMRNGIGREL